MASKRLTFLVILSLVSISLQDASDNEVEDEEVNPFAEAASAILKEQGAQNIGAMVNSFMQSGGAEKLGEMVSQFGSKNAGQLVQGLASLVGSAQKEKESEDGASDSASGANILESLGTLASVLQGTGGGGGDGAGALLQGLGSLLNAQGGGRADGGDGTAALLQGLGSLLGSKDGKEGKSGGGGIDPSVIGTVLNLFAQTQKESAKQGKKVRVQVGSKNTGETYDISDMLSMAATFLGGQGKGQGQGQAANLLQYLPMILQTVSSFSGPEAQKRAESHSDHASLVPPVLERLHLAFDNFIHSEMGKYLISAVGAEKAFKVFEDETGRFNYTKFTELMENLSFRRHWIRTVTDRLVDFLRLASDPKMQKSYLTNGQYLLNGFLKAQGFPKSTFFDPARPTETLSALVDHGVKRYFEVKVASKEYVKPMVEYVLDLNRLAQKKGSFGAAGVSKELSNKLADTINLEIIEPIARVNRAYRFAKATPSCDRYVLCTVNEKNPNEVETLPGLKKLLYKGTSLAAAWFLSEKTGTSFWTLYNDVLDHNNCKALYSDNCRDFHVEEIKVTTEYVHNEL